MLCLLFLCCCFYCCCTCVNTYTVITHLISTCRGWKHCAESKLREREKILPTNRYMCVCVRVLVCVCMCVCRGCKLCMARAALVLCLCLSLTLSNHIFQSTCEACCAFICIQFASNARRVRAPQRTQRTETREQRTENRVARTVCRV